MNTKLSTQPYKGTRDFYPEDYRLHQYIFGIVKQVLYRFGYEEYTAPLLEDTDLYRAKSGEEIVNEQTYSFEDRGGRDLTIRPEMTPSLARMVARRHGQYTYPLRWFSIPNLYRYERPQRGRLREHYQVNVDLFGSTEAFTDIEMLDIARSLLESFGAIQNMFAIHINDRRLIHAIYKHVLNLDEEQSTRVSKLVDRRDKMSAEEFRISLEELLSDQTTQRLIDLLDAPSYGKFQTQVAYYIETSRDSDDSVSDLLQELDKLFHTLHELGIQNVVFNFSLMRGFDYYTGLVFEVFDTHPDNRRALFGGGRYDNLLEIFDQPPQGAIGFGMGDVPLTDFLETHALLPEVSSEIDVYMCVLDTTYIQQAYLCAQTLRENGVRVIMDYSGRKLGAQLKKADAKQARHAIILGEQEVNEDKITVRRLATREQQTLSLEDAMQMLAKK